MQVSGMSGKRRACSPRHTEKSQSSASRGASSPSPRPSRGEGRGEGQPQTPEQASAPHPDPLPMLKKHGERDWGAARYVARVVSAGVPASVGSAADASVSAGSP